MEEVSGVIPEPARLGAQERQPSAEPSASWTPGPWAAEASVVGIGAPVIASRPGVEHIALLTRGQQGGGWPNAHLIAAAPDLYEALRGMVDDWHAHGGAYMSAALAALTKADGRAPEAGSEASQCDGGTPSKTGRSGMNNPSPTPSAEADVKGGG